MADNKMTVQIDGKDNLSAELKKIESGVIRFVGAVSSALAAFSVIAFPVMESARFQKELLEAGKTTDYAKSQLQELKGGLVELSTQINVTAIDLAKIATMGGQLGIGGGGNVGGLIAFTEEVARAVTALDVSAEEAVAAIGKLINIFNVPAGQYRNLISSLNEVSNASNATASELFDVVRRIGNLGGAVDLPQAAALAASMVDLGLTAETAGTTVTKIFADMKSKAAEFSNFIGGDMTAQRWVDLLNGDGLKALDLYLDRLNALPQAEAAAAKVTLTGGGRIFEAVTKLQQQRSRAADLELRAVRETIDLEANRGTLTKEQLATATEQVKRTKAQAREINVVTRLLDRANAAYKSGDSALKEQQTVLAGLSAQWVVFQNNLRKMAMGVGDVALLPLTDMLVAMSKALQNNDPGSQLADGMRDVISVLRTAAEYLGYFTEGITSLSSGVDWGAALRITALIAAMAVFKGMAGILGGLAASSAAAIPGLSSLSGALFGTAVAADKAATSVAASAAATGRVGGLYQRAKDATTAFATSLAEVETVQAAVVRGQAAVAAATATQIAQQQQLTQAQNGMSTRLRTRAALEAFLADAIVRRDAAQAAGEARSAAAINREIIRQQAVLFGLRTMEAGVAASTATIQRMNVELQESQQRLSALAVGTVGLVMGFRAAREAGQGVAAALASALNARTAPVFAPILTGAKAATDAVVRFGASLRSAFASGMVGATGLKAAVDGTRAAIMALTAAVVSGVGQAGVIATFRALAAVMNLRRAIVQTTMTALGLGEAWSVATSRIVQGALIAAAAVRSVGFAVNMLKKVFLGLVNIGFFALIIKDALEFLGLWNTVAKAIGRAFEFVGGDKAKLPQWLQSTEQQDRAIAKTEEQTAAIAAQRAEAGKYNASVAATVTLLRDVRDANKRLTFDSAAPTAAFDEIAAGIESVLASESKLSVIRSELYELDKRRLSQQKELQEAAAKLERRKGTAGERSAQREYDDVTAALNATNAALKDRRELEAIIGRDAPAAAKNIARNVLTSNQAIRILNGQLGEGTSLWERWADAQAKAVEAKRAADINSTKDQQAARAPTADSSGQARAAAQIAEAAALQTQLQDTAEAAALLESELRKQTPGNLAIAATMDAIKKTADPAAIRTLAANMAKAAQDGLSQFQGLAIPKMKAENLLQAGATRTVAAQLRDMYATMAVQANAAAEQAKNATTQAITAMQQAAKEAIDSVARLGAAFEETKRKAAFQKQDLGMDAGLRQRMLDIDIEYDKERKQIEARTWLSEESIRREMFALDEKYRVIRQEEQNIVDLKKARRGAEGELGEYDKLIGKVHEYKKIIEDATKVLANPAATGDEQKRALAAREEAALKAKEAMQQLEKGAIRLAGIDPIGGQLVIPPEKIAQFEKDLSTLGRAVQASMAAGAPLLEGVYKKQAGELSRLAELQNLVVKNADATIVQFSKSVAGGMDTVIRRMTEAYARTTEYQSAIGSLAKEIDKIKMAPGIFSQKDATDLSTRISRSISDAAQAAAATSIPLTVNQAKLQQSLVETFAGMGGTAATKVPVTTEIAEGSFKSMTLALEKNVKPKIQVDAQINSRGYSGVPGMARGGLIGSLKSFANGGTVRGPGTGTSDSILSWLSNGEYVMDALTTSKFGSKFFAALQSAARGGTAVPFAKKLAGAGMPRFATGGLVGSKAFSSKLPAIAAAENATQRDEVAISLTLGGQKLSLFGERQQAAKLVQAFKNMEAGA